MSTTGIDPDILYAWLCGRSLARGVPQPIADQGGFRVDTGTDAEISRDPRLLLKLCGEVDELRSVLPGGWQVEGAIFLMASGGERFEAASAHGCTTKVSRRGPVIAVQILADDGTLAASGYAGETPDALVYDRIVTSPAHRRQGLGRTVMAALQGARRYLDAPELLVATEAGRALYERLGWRTISAYSTATIVRT